MAKLEQVIKHNTAPPPATPPQQSNEVVTHQTLQQTLLDMEKTVVSSLTENVPQLFSVLQAKIENIAANLAQITWAPGHSGLEGNEAADRLARGHTNRAATILDPTTTLPVPAAYGARLQHLRKQRQLYPPPHKGLNAQEARDWRQLQTNTFPNLQKYSIIFPEHHKDACPWCNERPTAYHVTWGGKPIGQLPSPAETARPSCVLGTLAPLEAIAAQMSRVAGAHRVRVNFRLNIVAVGAATDAPLDPLLAVTEICGFPVRATSAPAESCTGYVFGVDRNLNDDILLANIESGVVVLRCFRAGRKLPAEVALFKVRRSVLPKRPRPRQCHHCGAYGHITAICTSEQRCLRCGGAHKTSGCTAKQATCLNCGGPHAATEPRCPSWQHERKVTETLASSELPITRRQATVLVRTMGQPTTQGPQQLAASRVPSRVLPGRSHSDATGDRPARPPVAGNTSTPAPRLPSASPDSRDAVIALFTAALAFARVFAAVLPRTPTVRGRPCRSTNTCQPWQLDLRVPLGRAYCSGTATPCAADTLSSQSTFLCTTTILALQESYARAEEVSLPGYIGYSSASDCAMPDAAPCSVDAHPPGRPRVAVYVRAALPHARPSRGATRVYAVVRWPLFREMCARPLRCSDYFAHIAEGGGRATTRVIVPAGTPCPDIKLLNVRAAADVLSDARSAPVPPRTGLRTTVLTRCAGDTRGSCADVAGRASARRSRNPSTNTAAGAS
ncbi:hypothetical protein HPB49_022336 [Dermacentor silvarum]|uniref:Uncharacterized protein n=1 Tax=Dermacentor silvarum TaxID=543639 RepID=A0ACB8DL90_DERSI|nr:hypothetical protein HPB49_022336 [Dermacentor silvarum]